ncbi:MAG: hypothetical protein K2X48_19440 [Chitinophagaceae bacterium]|nr:hypothetical protein [Chitinophagaceae bacterium]
MAEMKAKAAEGLASINNETDIKEILEHIEKLKNKEKSFDAEAFFKKAAEQYGEVLKKLAE